MAENNNNPKMFNILWVYIILILIFFFAINSLTKSPIQELDYSQLIRMINNNQIVKLNIENTGIVKAETKEGLKYDIFAPTMLYDKEYVMAMANTGIEVTYTKSITSSWWVGLISSLFPIIILILFWFWMLKPMMGGSGKSGGFPFSKNLARKYDPSKNKITFDKVAGIDEAKEELKDIVQYLKDPKSFNTLGARMPKGVILVGPPGTGKTLTARAVAGEAGVPFFYISGSDFVELYVGVGASRVRELFKQAKENSPAIIFIDEIDAVGRQRGAGLGGGNDEREQTLNSLLVEMDGFDDDVGVVVMAATNRPDILDKALLRPGRFDKKVVIDGPDLEGREEILKVHIRGKKIAPDVDLKTLAKRTPGFVGADLENLINEGALLAIRNKNTYITMEDLEEAIERVMAGPERKSRIISEKEKKILTYHELGHAFLGYLLPNSDPVHKITIVPRGHSALGYTLQLPEEDKFLISRSELYDRITIALGGRAAEQLIFDSITTGAGDDLKKATKYAKMMISKLGMSEKMGPMVWQDDDDEVFLGKELTRSKNYSDETAKSIDGEIKNIINKCYTLALKILEENKQRLDLIATYLYKVENISGEKFKELMEMDLYSLETKIKFDESV
ncbi:MULTISPECIES: ATP-dependent zinc metalloprotease FtsH [Oceanotoga]|jgi:cell division protease FtsH|uniref:ATP-dependent zinc metalloprotease FtsH n=1 Tax=Oceanotoga teriensis TaxID=515440 RepID=A0AA45C5Q6_9BACT|nr:MULTISPECIES: ATP-dependent zinc metalloprotease FtsH [Oceanotoga]MDN5341742.1 cell division protease FtsH [Oceanotoga sp.]MDO7976388.1 ATP-dependent zinc metalloprotease FtsH [Oceanotoga teriensis]PWJ89318.1 membrane protease FtsH catalytic subunit [Oceanotoga teriensis]